MSVASAATKANKLTAAQLEYLVNLHVNLRLSMPSDLAQLTKKEASELIDELKAQEQGLANDPYESEPVYKEF
jgi:hypothetical protein